MEVYRCKICGKIIPEHGYCDLHRPKILNNQSIYKHAIRYNKELYATWRWRKLRKTLITDGHCYYCGSNVSLQLHHIIRPKGDEELFFSLANLVVVCKKCHDRLTAKERRTD